MKSAIVLIIFTVLSGTIIVSAYFKKNIVLNVLQTSALTQHYSENDDAINNLEADLKSNPDNRMIILRLAFTYIQKARETGNFSEYDEKALRLFEQVLKKDKNDFEALIGKSTVLLSQHKFFEAIETGKAAIKVNPYNASGYGILTDGYVETGNYKKAIECADKMAEVRPDLRSYSRISYLREIFGDFPGAIEAMKLAVSAGVDGKEETEWARYQLGCLYEKTGQLVSADLEFQKSIAYRPSFDKAYLGHGRVLQKRKMYDSAEKFYRYADTLSNDYQASMHLARLYRETNRQSDAAREIRNAIAILSGQKEGKTNVRYTGKELAELYIESFDYLKALENAKAEYNRRPDNIDVNHTLAWTYYKIGNYDKALLHIEQALSTGSNDAELLIHSSLIHKKKGFEAISKAEVKKAFSINEEIGFMLKTELR